MCLQLGISLFERLALFLPNPLGNVPDDPNFVAIHHGPDVPHRTPQGEEQSCQK